MATHETLRPLFLTPQTLEERTQATSVIAVSYTSPCPHRRPPAMENVCMPTWALLTFQLKVISKERREGKLPLVALTQSAGEITKSLNLFLCHNQQILHNGFRICLSTQKLKVQNLHY